MTKDMKIYFVLPSHCEDEQSTSEEMQQAFELCRQNQIIPEWIAEKNCPTIEFNRKDIVVFEKFEGENFQQARTRLSIAGPWCIITCLLEGLQVPNNKSPILNMAMNKLVITASNYSAEQKKRLKEKIEMMGGVFSLHITSNVTHLISNSVRTQKYVVANEKNIPVMLDSWVENVWIESQKRRVRATDEEFQGDKCPPLMNLRVCCTGLDARERDNLQKVVLENGGIYSGRMVVTATDLLICKPGTKSEKLEVARKAKLPCVRLEWIYDSISNGHALPETDYVVKLASSTPTKNDAPLNPDFSMMSFISGKENTEETKTSASETMEASLYDLNGAPNILQDLDWKKVQNAGNFLDGCGVLLVGWSGPTRDYLCRVLRSAGATRYDAPNDRVTHILTENKKHFEGSISAPMVSISWLVASVENGRPALEEPYLVQAQLSNSINPSSPLSKKGISFLLENDSKIAKEILNPIENDDEFLKNVYRNQVSNDITCDEQSLQDTFCTIFQNYKFMLRDLSEDESEKIASLIEEMNGKIVVKTPADYCVVPFEARTGGATELVTPLWIYDCKEQDKLLEPSYYHRPILKQSTKRPLENCVVTISGYSGMERSFLVQLIQFLGAVYQDKFARVSLPDNSVHKSTHLVCREPQGSKFAAAQRWGRTVVTHEWLLQCLETDSYVAEKDFLLPAESSMRENIAEVKGSKRDFEGNRISPPDKVEAEPLVTLEDGRKMTLENAMVELKKEGLYDTPPQSTVTPKRLQLTGACSQDTPVGRYLRGLEERNVLPTSPAADSPMPRPLSEVLTPETPLGRFLGDDNPSRSTRKHWQKYLDRFPHYKCHERPPPRPRRPSTPWDEIKKQAWASVLKDKQSQNLPSTSDEAANRKPVEEAGDAQREVSEQFGQLQDMLRQHENSAPRRSLLLTLDGHHSSNSNPVSTAKDSQADVVGWDEPLETNNSSPGQEEAEKIFMLSGFEAAERAGYCEALRALGGSVSEMRSFDPRANYVICATASRNEKILASMAAGKWLLHSSYIQRSTEAGHFLPAAKFELGNPEAETELESPLTAAMHWWRLRVRRTQQGAFYQMRALIFAKNVDAIVRLIEAGGGSVLHAEPPFLHALEATHCFIDTKLKLDLNNFVPLAQQGVPCLNVLYLSNYLTNQTNVNITEFIMPTLKQYYN